MTLRTPDPAASALASSSTTPGEPVRVDLAWRDPVSGMELLLDLEAHPQLVARLLEEGFQVSMPAGGDSAAA